MVKTGPIFLIGAGLLIATALVTAMVTDQPRVDTAAMAKASHDLAVACYKEGRNMGVLEVRVERAKEAGLTLDPVAIDLLKKSPTSGCR